MAISKELNPLPKPGLWVRVALSLRALIRRDEIGLLFLALCTGAIAGVLTSGVLTGSAVLHRLFFQVSLGGHLSSLERLASPWEVIVPCAGGLFLGVTGHWLRKWRPRRPVDPIEANALHGGRMSVIDSLIITFQTILSNGCGASVGLEAAYTQIGSGLASWLGGLFRLRRSDMRTLVACGSAGAIAAAFGAPLTGAFYAFELILGTYTPFGLAPVGLAAVGGVLISQALGVTADFNGHAEAFNLTRTDMSLLLGLGVVCAVFGIGIMRAVTFVETLFKASHLPQAFQPMAGGMILGGLAYLSPHLLASGHGALTDLFESPATPALDGLAAMLFLKALASSISIGSGFRGGLFFASLYLGGLLGKCFFSAIALYAPALAPDPWVCGIVGMAGLAAAILGGPLTMSFLALETTGNVLLSLVMLAVATLVSVIVRRNFGYSFATWRLHLRGESIRSAQDIGWIRDLTVGRLMRVDVEFCPPDIGIAGFKARFPLGAAKWVVVKDGDGKYAGMISVVEAYLKEPYSASNPASLAALIRNKTRVLTADMNIKTAAQIFEQSESEALVVVNDPAQNQVAGLLTEAHLLRRYAEELDTARRELAGERNV